MSQLSACGAPSEPGTTRNPRREAERCAPSPSRDYSRLEKTAFSRERTGRLTVAVVGAGALGNEVIKNLALLGVGRLAVFDRDRLEASISPDRSSIAWVTQIAMLPRPPQRPG